MKRTISHFKISVPRLSGILLWRQVEGRLKHEAPDWFARKAAIRHNSNKLSKQIVESHMPVIARFYGILIKMYFREHGVAHFHAIYGEYNGVFEIDTLQMIEGDLPARAQRLVKEWAAQYQADLRAMWNSQEFRQLPGLE